MPPNTLDYAPLMRRLLTALDDWVNAGKEPPPSRYPRIVDGTLVAMTAPTGTIPGFTMAKASANRPRVDYGPEFEKGIISRTMPVTLPETYPTLVPRMDGDGNDIAGIRLPAVSVPVATATGWSVRAADAGGAGELCYLDGSYVPFSKTKDEREAKADSRPSLEERYGDASTYATRLAAAATALAKEGYLLDEDVPRIAAQASGVKW